MRACFPSRVALVLVLAASYRLEAAAAIAEPSLLPLQFNAGGALGLAKADLNGDGILDVASTNFTPEGSFIAAFLGDGDGRFHAPWTFPVADGAFANGIVARDFDGDGTADLAAGVFQTAVVQLFHGRGDGTFDSPTAATLDTVRPTDLQAADIESDGDLDLVVVGTSEGALIVLRGRGDGSFEPPVRLQPGRFPQDMALADVDGVNGPDIVFGSSEQRIGVFLNDGAGVYPATPTTYGVRKIVTGIQIADYTGDGLIDIAASVTGPGPCGDCVLLLRNLGGGVFEDLPPDANYFAPGFLTVPGRFRSENAPVDLNGDGRADPIFLNLRSSHVVVCESRGDGSFDTALWGAFPGAQASVTTLAGPNANACVAGDFTGDGLTDLLVATLQAPGGSPGGIALLRARAPGNFDTPRALALSRPWSTADRGALLVDLDEDGALDLAATTDCLDLARGLGDGRLGLSATAQESLNQAGETFRGLLTADFDRDRHPDLVWFGRPADSDTASLPRVLIGYGDGDATIGNLRSYVPGNSTLAPIAAAVADFNGDGSPDLAVRLIGSSGGTVIEVLQYGLVAARTFSRVAVLSLNPSVTPGSSVAAGDFDRDGDADIVAHVADGGVGHVLLFKGQGNGNFDPPSTSADGPGETVALTAVDVDRDSIIDLVALHGDSVSVLRGVGDGAFPTTRTHAAGVASLSDAVLVDFDGDGLFDLAATGAGTAPAGLTLSLGRGDGSFLPATGLGLGGAGSRAVEAGDLDGDGRADLVIATQFVSRSLFNVLRNNSGPRADLALTLIPSQTTVDPDAEVVWTATVENLGPDNAASVRLRIPRRRGLPLTGVSASQGSLADEADRIVAELGALAVGASASLRFAGVSDREGELFLTAAASSEHADPVALNSTAASTVRVNGGPFIRSDADCSGTVTIADAIALLFFHFNGAKAPCCDRAADSDGSGSLEATDAIYLLLFLFAGGAAPPAPFPACGGDSCPGHACSGTPE